MPGTVYKGTMTAKPPWGERSGADLEGFQGFTQTHLFCILTMNELNLK